jgi:hypothetical protein
MKTQEELLKEHGGDKFAVMMYYVAITEGKKAMAENERLQSDPTAAVSEVTHRRCMELIHRAFLRKNTTAT